MNVKHRPSDKRHFPVHEELVKGELKATISLHQVEDRGISCWCYKSEGLAAYEQREVAFTLVRRPGERPETYPREPLKFFRMLLEAVKEGSRVDVGGASAIEDDVTMLGFGGVGFIEAPAVGGLAMIGLTREEVEAFELYGMQRVFSLIGKAGRCFPAPYWSARGRKSSISLKNMEASVLNTVMRIHDSGFSVYRENARIMLRARRDERWLATSMTLRDTPVDMTLALLTELHPSCDGELNWELGQGQPAGVMKPGSEGLRVGGSFVVIRPGQAEDSAQIVEDGYVLGFKQESWDLLRDAILTQKTLSLETCELGWEKCRLGGIFLCISASTVLITLATPAAASRGRNHRFRCQVSGLSADTDGVGIHVCQPGIVAGVSPGLRAGVTDSAGGNPGCHPARGSIDPVGCLSGGPGFRELFPASARWLRGRYIRGTGAAGRRGASGRRVRLSSLLWIAGG